MKLLIYAILCSVMALFWLYIAIVNWKEYFGTPCGDLGKAIIAALGFLLFSALLVFLLLEYPRI